MTTKLYIGTKVIEAKPMTEKNYVQEHSKHLSYEGPNRSGYLVTYADGYVSWSPKATFEAAYREITKEELALVEGR